MATENITIDKNWTQVASDTDEDFLISNGKSYVEYAISDGEPSVDKGHILGPGDSLTRRTIGPGVLYARILDSVDSDEHVLVITK